MQSMHFSPKSLCQGFVLIIVISILGVLAFLALALVQTASSQGVLGKSFVYKTHSRLAARSGLEKAMVACRLFGFVPSSAFELQLSTAGDDRNRNGVEDADEDLHEDDFSTFSILKKQLTPSLALAEDPSAPFPRSRVYYSDENPHGASWASSDHDSDLISIVSISNSSALDINGGVLTGKGFEGNPL